MTLSSEKVPAWKKFFFVSKDKGSRHEETNG